MSGFIQRLRSKDTNLFYISLFGIVFLVILLFLLGKPACSKIECLYIDTLDNFKVKEVYQDDNEIYRALYSKDSDLVGNN